MPDFTVTEVPRQHARTILQTDRLAMALDFVERQVNAPSARLMLWWPDAPSTAGPEITVAVPLKVYQEIEVVADQIVEDGDRAWLLIDSTGPSQRDATRGDLIGAIAAALLSAAVTGLDEGQDNIVI